MPDADKPVTLTWTSGSDFKTWDFVCVDEHQMPVTRFVANVWAVKTVGRIEFLGSRAGSEALRDGIVVTGLTLIYCMALRSASLLSFFGVFFASPGYDKKDKSVYGSESRDAAEPGA